MMPQRHKEKQGSISRSRSPDSARMRYVWWLVWVWAHALCMLVGLGLCACAVYIRCSGSVCMSCTCWLVWVCTHVLCVLAVLSLLSTKCSLGSFSFLLAHVVVTTLYFLFCLLSFALNSSLKHKIINMRQIRILLSVTTRQFLQPNSALVLIYDSNISFTRNSKRNTTRTNHRPSLEVSDVGNDKNLKRCNVHTLFSIIKWPPAAVFSLVQLFLLHNICMT